MLIFILLGMHFFWSIESMQEKHTPGQCIIHCSDEDILVSESFVDIMNEQSGVIKQLNCAVRASNLFDEKSNEALFLPLAKQQILGIHDLIHEHAFTQENYLYWCSPSYLIQLSKGLDYLDWQDPVLIEKVNYRLKDCVSELTMKEIDHLPLGTQSVLAHYVIDHGIKPYVLHNRTLQEIKSERCGFPGNMLAFSWDGTKFMKGLWNTQVAICDVETKNEDYNCNRGDSRGATAGALNYDGSISATARQDARAFAQFWNDRGECLWQVPFGDHISALCLDYKGDLSALAWNSDILLLDVKNKQDKGIIKNNILVTVLAMNYDGSLLAAGSEKSIKLWCTSSKKLLHTIFTRSFTVDALAFHNDLPCLVALINDSWRTDVLFIDSISGIKMAHIKGANAYKPLTVLKNKVMAIMSESKSWRDTSGICQWNVRELFDQMRALEGISLKQALFLAARLQGYKRVDQKENVILPPEVKHLSACPKSACVVS